MRECPIPVLVPPLARSTPPLPLSVLLFFAFRISFKALNLLGFVTTWDSHLLLFVSFTHDQHQIEV
jgi:hypothetical protein